MLKDACAVGVERVTEDCYGRNNIEVPLDGGKDGHNNRHECALRNWSTIAISSNQMRCRPSSHASSFPLRWGSTGPLIHPHPACPLDSLVGWIGFPCNLGWSASRSVLARLLPCLGWDLGARSTRAAGLRRPPPVASLGFVQWEVLRGGG